MPSSAPRLKIDNTRALGAEVVLYDREAGEDRDAIGRQIAKDRDLHLIKPFDNHYVIAGQGTTGLEIAGQAADMGLTQAEVLTCCGGGGLTAGIALALEAKAPAMTVRPVEPVGFDDVTRSLQAGDDPVQYPAYGQYLRRDCHPCAGGYNLSDPQTSVRPWDRGA